MPLDVRLPVLSPEDAQEDEDATKQVSDGDLEAALEAGRTEKHEEPSEKPKDPSASFRPISEARETPDVIYINGKRMRKKKKMAPEPVAERAPPAPEPSDPAVFRPRSAKPTAARDSAVPPAPANEATTKASRQDTPVDRKVQSKQSSTKPIVPVSTQEVPTEETLARDPESVPPTTEIPSIGARSAAVRPSFVPQVDDADDIFADAGEWEGLSDEEAAPSAAAVQPRHGDWFASGREEPTDEAAASPPHSPPSDAPPARLEGLSSSALPSEMSRWLLEREDDAPRRAHAAPPKRKRSKKGRGDPDSP